MSEVKDDAVMGSGSLPIESAPGETNDTKTEERSTVEVGDKTDAAVETELKDNAKELDSATARKEGEEKATREEQLEQAGSESHKEDKVVQEAVKQITFYLSDSNLPYDKHLFTLSQEKKEESAPMGTGWISLSKILGFKRMQAIVNKSSRSPTICEFAIVNALRSAYPSKDENALLEVSGDGHDIRRRKALTPPGQTGQLERSVYAKGFPDEEERDDSGKDSGRKGNNYAFSELQKSLETWFESLNCGRVNAVRMRRDDKKKFKNSVFVEFATEESAKTFLDLEPKPTYFGQSEPLEAMSKKAYIDMKAKEKGIEPTYGENKQSSARPQGGNNRRAFNAFKDAESLNNRGDRDGRRGDRGWGNDEPSGPVKIFVEGKEMEVDSESGMIKNQEDIEYTPGKVLKFGGAVNNDEANPLELKKALTEIHPAIFVDFDRTRGQGAAFFKEPIDDGTLLKIQSADLTLGGSEAKLKWIMLTGSEEKQYHVDRANKRASIALADAKSGGSGGRNNNNSGGRGGGRGGRGGDRGRGGRGGNRGGRGDRRGGGSGVGRGGDRRDNNRGGDRDSRPSDRNDERQKNDKKREREDDAPPAQKGNAIGVPVAGSSGPAPDPPAKKAKTEDT